MGVDLFYELTKEALPISSSLTEGVHLSEIVAKNCSYETFSSLDRMGLILEGVDGLLDFLYGDRELGGVFVHASESDRLISAIERNLKK